MTDYEFRLARKKILAEQETAERIGCKRVIADCKHQLQELETRHIREKKRNCRYEGPSMEAVISDDTLNPTMKFVVTFDNGFKTEMVCYSKPTIGLERREVEQDFMDGYNAVHSSDNKPKMIKAHLIPMRGGQEV